MDIENNFAQQQQQPQHPAPRADTNLLDGTFEEPPALQAPLSAVHLKSNSTDDFEHIMADKFDSPAAAAAAAANAATAQLPPPAKPDFHNFQTQADYTMNFMASERGGAQVHSVLAAAPAPVAAAAPQAVHLDDDGDDDDTDEEEEEPVDVVQPKQTQAFGYDDTAAEKYDNDVILQPVAAAAAPLKASIYDDLERQQKQSADAAHKEKFISSEDLLGEDFGSGFGVGGGFGGSGVEDVKTEQRPQTPDFQQEAEQFEEPEEEEEEEEEKPLPKTVDIEVAAPVIDPVVVKPPAPVEVIVKPVEVVKPVEPVKPQPVERKAAKPAATTKADAVLFGEESFFKYGLVESLIYWRDVKKSGIVFGAGIVFLLAVSIFSVISVFAYTSLIALVAAISFRIYKNVLQAVQKTPEGHPFAEYLNVELALPQEKVQELASVGVAHVNALVVELRRLFLVEDLIDSIKFGGLLWGLTYLGSWFNGITLVILAFVALFTFPKIYENNKQDIDAQVGLVRSKIEEITEKIKAAVPIGKKAAVAATESEKDKALANDNEELNK